MINDKFIVVAGPCSAESFEQLHDTVMELSQIKQIDLIRCGAWKPRSLPGGFQGAGEKALEWIRQIKSENPSFKFAIEVALPHQAELALQYDIDALWVGARTVSNPFSVQELASALKGASIPVMIKNPIAPDIKMWIGAIERFQRAGLPLLYAVHRGFSTLSPYGLRNAPLWTIPLELKKIMPEIPLLCDPSHLCGDASLIEPFAKDAVLLGFDGIMVESHNHPDQALTDAKQQLTPSKLNRILFEIEALTKNVDLYDWDKVILKERIEILENEQSIISSELEKARIKYHEYLNKSEKLAQPIQQP